MSGHYNGLQVLIAKKALKALLTHWIIHRESLASKNFSSALNDMLFIEITVVNYIKIRPQKARIFLKNVTDTEAEHISLLYYCKCR